MWPQTHERLFWRNRAHSIQTQSCGHMRASSLDMSPRSHCHDHVRKTPTPQFFVRWVRQIDLCWQPRKIWAQSYNRCKGYCYRDWCTLKEGYGWIRVPCLLRGHSTQCRSATHGTILPSQGAHSPNAFSWGSLHGQCPGTTVWKKCRCHLCHRLEGSS